MVGTGSANACPVEQRRSGARRRSTGGVTGAGQLGQHAGVGEPCRVVGVADQHGGAGRGAQHPGRGDLLADQAVHDGRLAGTGGAADDGEQRGVEAAQAGEHVVVELPDELGAGLAGSSGTRDVELEAGGGGGLAQRDAGERPVVIGPPRGGAVGCVPDQCPDAWVRTGHVPGWPPRQPRSPTVRPVLVLAPAAGGARSQLPARRGSHGSAWRSDWRRHPPGW